MQQVHYEIITSKDGSHSVQIKDTAITFHSTRGAIQESRHIFINAGLYYFKKLHKDRSTIRIFEVGFGTGLNALLTAIEAVSMNTAIEYHSIDLYPLPQNTLSKLNYGKIVNAYDLYKTITQADWGKMVTITSLFNMQKTMADIEHYSFYKKFDVVYFDAFAPNDQPELWTEALFGKICDALNQGGLLVTYCSKSVVQKAMKAVGFIVEKIPGPPGKREILRATKP